MKPFTEDREDEEVGKGGSDDGEEEEIGLKGDKAEVHEPEADDPMEDRNSESADHKDDNCVSVPRAEDIEEKSEGESEEKTEDAEETTKDRSEPAKSLLSNIKGVDGRRLMSKELEDLSKTDAQSSPQIKFQITEVNHSGEDKQKDDTASNPAILTITVPTKNATQEAPKEKSDGGDDSVVEVTPYKGSQKKKTVPHNMLVTAASLAHTVFAVKVPVRQLQPKLNIPALPINKIIEAPSLVVPYLYQKPPVTSLKEYITDMENALKEQEKEEKEKKKVEKANRKEEKGVDKTSEERAEGDSETDDKESRKYCVKSDDKDSDYDHQDTPIQNDDNNIVDDICKKSKHDFDNPLGKFFMQIGFNLVQEHVQTDMQKTRTKQERNKDGENCPPEVDNAVAPLMKTLECWKDNNKPNVKDMKTCYSCNFKTESALVMAHHLDEPHLRNNVYRCNFCTVEAKSPDDIVLHMGTAHNVHGRLEKVPAPHQCPNCPYENKKKIRVSRHSLSCTDKFKPERNQEPSLDWEMPAKPLPVKRPSPFILGGHRPGIPGGHRPGIPGVPHKAKASLAPKGGVPLWKVPTPAICSSLAPRRVGKPPILSNPGGVPVVVRQSHHSKLFPAQRKPGLPAENAAGSSRTSAKTQKKITDFFR